MISPLVLFLALDCPISQFYTAMEIFLQVLFLEASNLIWSYIHYKEKAQGKKFYLRNTEFCRIFIRFLWCWVEERLLRMTWWPCHGECLFWIGDFSENIPKILVHILCYLHYLMIYKYLHKSCLELSGTALYSKLMRRVDQMKFCT